MSATITEAPSSTKSRTVASPMPLEPPVISATLPLRRAMPSSVLVRLQRVLATRHVFPQSAGPNCEPDEARGRPQPEAYVGIRRGLRPTENEVWRSQVGPALREPHGARHGLEMVRRVAEVKGGGHDALVEEMQGVLLTEADGAQELVRLARDGLRAASRVGLGHGNLGVGVPAHVDPRGRAINETACRLHVAQEIGAGVLDGLKRPERAPELLASLRVLHGDVKDALGAAHHLGGAGEGARLERGAQRFPSASRRAEEILRPQLCSRKIHLARPVARHRLHGEHGDAWPPRVEQEEVHSRAPARGHDQLVGDVRVVHEELAAREPGARLAPERDGLAVDRRALLGEGEDADALAARQSRQVSLALRDAAAGGDEGGGHHRTLHVRAREARAPHLFEEEGHVQHVAAAASVLRGDEEAGPAQDGDFLPELSGEATLAGHTLRHGAGWTLAAEKLARRVHEELLGGREMEVHELLGPARRLSSRLLARSERLGSNGHLSPHLLARSERLGSNGNAHARASAGRPRPRVATVERRISEVPPAMVWPRLVW